MILEFWVMRVLLHPGPRRAAVTFANLPPDQHPHVLAYVARGELCLLPDSCIAEPVEVFAAQLDAHAHRERLQADHPEHDYRVVLNSSVTV